MLALVGTLGWRVPLSWFPLLLLLSLFTGYCIIGHTSNHARFMPRCIYLCVYTYTYIKHCFAISTGCRAWWQGPATDPPEGECRQPSGGWSFVEGPFHGCGQGQKAAAPTGYWDWERVSLYQIDCIKILSCSQTWFLCSPSIFQQVEMLSLIFLKVWKTCMTGGPRTVPLSEISTISYQIWSSSKRLTGDPC